MLSWGMQLSPSSASGLLMCNLTNDSTPTCLPISTRVPGAEVCLSDVGETFAAMWSNCHSTSNQQ